MVLIKINKIDEEKAIVNFIHYMPELLSENEKKDGILIEELPNVESIEGKRTIIYYNLKNKTVTCEYEDIKENVEYIDLKSRIKILEEDNKKILEELSNKK